VLLTPLNVYTMNLEIMDLTAANKRWPRTTTIQRNTDNTVSKKN